MELSPALKRRLDDQCEAHCAAIDKRAELLKRAREIISAGGKGFSRELLDALEDAENECDYQCFARAELYREMVRELGGNPDKIVPDLGE